MEAFEYRLLSVEQGPYGSIGQLNRFGLLGWEAVGQMDCVDEDAGPPEPVERVRYLLLKRSGPGNEGAGTGVKVARLGA